MKVRFLIDRVIFDGLNLTSAQRVAFEEQLHASIVESLHGYVTTGQRHPNTLPAPRVVSRERIELWAGAYRESLGATVGNRLADHVWLGRR